MSILQNEITNPRQHSNGTRAFLCKRTGATYTSHSNGYVRRKTKSGYQYPLNERVSSVSTHQDWTDSPPASNTTYIMIHPEYKRLGLINKRAESYMPNNKSQYAIAYIEVEPGDRRLHEHIRTEDTALALEVLRAMQTKGTTIGVTPTNQIFDPKDVTSRKTLLEMLDVAKKLREFNPSIYV